MLQIISVAREQQSATVEEINANVIGSVGRVGDCLVSILTLASLQYKTV